MGSLVKVIKGKHEGLKGKVLAMTESDENKKRKIMGDEEISNPDSRVSVELVPSASVVVLKKSYLLLISAEEKDERNFTRTRSRSKETRNPKKLKWVVPGILVRVVSKEVENGKLYTHKFKITEVFSESQF